MPVQMKGTSILHCHLLQSERATERRRVIEREMGGDRNEGRRDKEDVCVQEKKKKVGVCVPMSKESE